MNALTVIPRPQAPEFSLNEIGKIAQVIAAGKLFGSNDVDAIMTLCLLAHAEGLHPVAVMRDYHMIQGKPSKKSEAMQRDFLSSGGSIEWHRLDDTAAEATFSHPAGGSVRIDWTLERAQKAGLLGNAMWKKYPRQMLKSRLISEGARTVFPGATSGMYVPEEVIDFETPAPSRRASLAAPDNAHASGPDMAPSAPPTGAWPDGPCTSKTALQAEYKAFVRNLHSATSSDDVEGLIDDAKPMLAQFRAAAKVGILTDDYRGGGDFKGVEATIAEARLRVAHDDGVPREPGDAAAVEDPTTAMLREKLEDCTSSQELKAWSTMNQPIIAEQPETVRDELRERFKARERAFRTVDRLAA